MSWLMNRRRGIAKSDIQILKDMGCLFWFPMTKESGLKDVVNGYELEIIKSGSIVFDDGNQMYKITYPSNVNEVFASATLNLKQSDFEGGVTTYSCVTRINYGSANWLAIGKVDSSIGFFCFDDVNLTSDMSRWNKDTYDAFISQYGLNRGIYVDGVLKRQDDLSVDITTIDTTTLLAFPYATWTRNRQLYTRGFALFNRELSSEEVTIARKILVW